MNNLKYDEIGAKGCPACGNWHQEYTHGCLCDCHNNGEE